MRILFIFLCLFSLIAKSQNIVGKWKVVAINNGTYYNYKDSASSMEQFINSLKGKKDSSESAAIFKRTISLYKNYYFSFNEDGTYKETQGRITIGSTSKVFEFNGTYEIDFAHKYIELSSTNKTKYYYTIEFIPTGIKLYYFADGLISRGRISDLSLTLENSK